MYRLYFPPHCEGIIASERGVIAFFGELKDYPVKIRPSILETQNTAEKRCMQCVKYLADNCVGGIHTIRNNGCTEYEDWDTISYDGYKIVHVDLPPHFCATNGKNFFIYHQLEDDYIYPFLMLGNVWGNGTVCLGDIPANIVDLMGLYQGFLDTNHNGDLIDIDNDDNTGKIAPEILVETWQRYISRSSSSSRNDEDEEDDDYYNDNDEDDYEGLRKFDSFLWCGNKPQILDRQKEYYIVKGSIDKYTTSLHSIPFKFKVLVETNWESRVWRNAGLDSDDSFYKSTIIEKIEE